MVIQFRFDRFNSFKGTFSNRNYNKKDKEYGKNLKCIYFGPDLYNHSRTFRIDILGQAISQKPWITCSLGIRKNR